MRKKRSNFLTNKLNNKVKMHCFNLFPTEGMSFHEVNWTTALVITSNSKFCWFTYAPLSLNLFAIRTKV